MKKIFSIRISMLVLLLLKRNSKNKEKKETSKKRSSNSSSSSCKISFDSSNKKQKKSLKEKKQKKDFVPTSWTSSNITTLLSIVRDHIVSGNVHTDSGFKNAYWKHFETEFHKQTSLSYSRQPMQSKLSELKRKFVQLVAIKKLSGVGWNNAETCLPVVPPDFIKNYCTGSKKRLSVMFTKKLDNFDLLQEIYEGKVCIKLLR